MAIRQHGLFSRTFPGWIHAKSACYVYESNEEGIDTGIIIEGEGTLFLGRVAIQEMAEVYGFSIGEDGQKLEEENAHLIHENNTLREQVRALTSDLETFGRAIASARAKTVGDR